MQIMTFLGFQSQWSEKGQKTWESQSRKLSLSILPHNNQRLDLDSRPKADH